MISIPITEGETIYTIKIPQKQKINWINNISSEMIKHCAIEISKPLTYLI